MTMVRVFLISDFELLLSGLSRLIELRPERCQIVGSARNMDCESAPWADCAPDVVLLDLDTDPDLLLHWLGRWRGAGAPRVLLLSRHDNPVLQDQAFLAGARGLLDRHSSPEQLLAALDKVHAGQVWLNRDTTGRLLERLASPKAAAAIDDPVEAQLGQLTQRERAILILLLNSGGDPAKVLADRMHISESTLRNHLTSIYDKLGVSNRNGLLTHAMQNGLAARLGH